MGYDLQVARADHCDPEWLVLYGILHDELIDHRVEATANPESVAAPVLRDGQIDSRSGR